jgi:hypothetical protein
LRNAEKILITIRLCGGLGNTLFQLALGIAFEARGRNVVYDVSLLDADRGRRYLLADFGLNLNIVRDNAPVTYQEKSLCYDPDVLNLESGVLNGYWQNEKYFADHAPYIRSILFRHMKFSEKTLEIAQKIKEAGERSCFIHVRRTDNLRATSTLYHGLTEPENSLYYSRVIDLVGIVSAFVFSDDPTWAKENLSPFLNAVFVTHNGVSFTEDETHNLHKNDAGREVEDLWLMSLCRHAIIANSTFSFWGSWLNMHESEEPRTRIVIAPDPWYSSDEAGPTEIIPERWTKVSTK